MRFKGEMIDDEIKIGHQQIEPVNPRSGSFAGSISGKRVATQQPENPRSVGGESGANTLGSGV